jgi:hypothetical protein
MKFVIFLFLGIFIPRSGEGQQNLVIPFVADVTTTRPEMMHDGFSNTEEDYFLIIADTAQNYYSIRSQVNILSTKYNIEFDSLGRIFDAQIDSIIIPRNSEDEMYAGQYVPRRFLSSTSSAEYLSAYQTNSSNNTFALVAGIFETIQNATDAALIITSDFPKLYILKTRIYIGCMH